MLFSGLLYFMVHATYQCPQFADKSCAFLPVGSSFPPGLRLSPTSLLPPKLPIKSNLASWEIKPTLAEEWHQLQVSHCAFGIYLIPLLPLCLCLSLSLSFPPTPHSGGPFFFFYDPRCPSQQMNVQLQNRFLDNMVTVHTGHLCGWIHDPNLQIESSSY